MVSPAATSPASRHGRRRMWGGQKHSAGLPSWKPKVPSRPPTSRRRRRRAPKALRRKKVLYSIDRAFEPRRCASAEGPPRRSRTFPRRSQTQAFTAKLVMAGTFPTRSRIAFSTLHIDAPKGASIQAMPKGAMPVLRSERHATREKCDAIRDPPRVTAIDVSVAGTKWHQLRIQIATVDCCGGCAGCCASRCASPLARVRS